MHTVIQVMRHTYAMDLGVPENGISFQTAISMGIMKVN